MEEGVDKEARTESRGQVALADGHSGVTILKQLLQEAGRAFPGVFDHLDLDLSSKAFRAGYDQLLPQFELARLASSQRADIARFMCQQLAPLIAWTSDDATRPLHEALQQAAPGLALKTHTFSADPGWAPEIVYQGQRYGVSEVGDLGRLLAERGVVTQAAAEALAWLQAAHLAQGTLNLRDRKIAVLGGGAEMAPTRFWLEAGADVLWLDVQPPPQEWFTNESLSGRLFWPEDNVDLLTQPQAVLATLKEFAAGEPLDLCLYAYAPGQAREVRLTACMNALVDALPAAQVASVTMLVSPTTPTGLSSQDLQAMQDRRGRRPMWEALCAKLGLLGRGGGSLVSGQAAVTRTVVAIQGASYQAAQYLGKVLMAETWATSGQLNQPESVPLRVSANTAAITRTRSLAHPVFTAAFGGAAAMAVESMTPRQSRRLNGLLAVRDWLHPDKPVPGEIRVHGGIHTLPYPLGSALRIAAVIGFARAPRLLRGLIR